MKENGWTQSFTPYVFIQLFIPRVMEKNINRKAGANFFLASR